MYNPQEKHFQPKCFCSVAAFILSVKKELWCEKLTIICIWQKKNNVQ